MWGSTIRYASGCTSLLHSLQPRLVFKRNGSAKKALSMNSQSRTMDTSSQTDIMPTFGDNENGAALYAKQAVRIMALEAKASAY